MKVLGIETSTLLGGVALVEDDLLVAESRINVAVAHSERLMGEIAHVLRHARLAPDAVDAIAVSIGPGSFTGLRVGLSTAKGLAYGTGKPLVAVPTLEALAWNVPFSRYQVCPLLDARKQQVYAGLFSWSGTGFDRVFDEGAFGIEDLLRRIGHPTVFLGEGALLYRDRIREGLGDDAYFAPGNRIVPSPSNVAMLGMIKAREGAFADPVSVTPLYLRKSEAETAGEGRDR